MTKWECHSCDIGCKFERDCDPFFSPERCIYKERGNGDKIAKWEMTLQ